LSLVVVPETIFTHEELRDYLNQIRARAPHYLEIMCGCTSGRYGDCLGLLKIKDDGTISVVRIIDTSFLKYYTGDNFRRPHNESGHRDQFLRCTACDKVRRFELRLREIFRCYHDAAANGRVRTSRSESAQGAAPVAGKTFGAEDASIASVSDAAFVGLKIVPADHSDTENTTKDAEERFYKISS
ncbi:hypothetical protein Ccrd_022676, partial [Cynara cardunculus var. scolymus]